jgi:hypothetical protein
MHGMKKQNTVAIRLTSVGGLEHRLAAVLLAPQTLSQPHGCQCFGWPRVFAKAVFCRLARARVPVPTAR